MAYARLGGGESESGYHHQSAGSALLLTEVGIWSEGNSSSRERKRGATDYAPVVVGRGARAALWYCMLRIGTKLRLLLPVPASQLGLNDAPIDLKAHSSFLGRFLSARQDFAVNIAFEATDDPVLAQPLSRMEKHVYEGRAIATKRDDNGIEGEMA